MAKTMTMEELEQSFITAAIKFKNGKEAKKHVNKQGTQLLKQTKTLAKIRVKKRSGKLYKSIKKSRARKSKHGNVYMVVNYKMPSGKQNRYPYIKEVGYVHTSGKYIPGTYIMRDSSKNFEDDFQKATDAWVEDLLDNEGLV